MNILITNVGRRTYFIDFLKEIKKKYKKMNIFVSDSNKNCAGMFDDTRVKKFLTPKVSKKKKYLEYLLKISKKNKIDLIIPVSDRDLDLLSLNKDLFKKINTKVLVSSNDVVKLCASKILMKRFCKKNKLLTPEIFSNKKKNYKTISI